VEQGDHAVKIHQHILIGLALVVAGASATEAATLVFTADLAGPNEVPPVMTTGTGVATVTFDDVTNILTVQAAFAELTGATTAAHIHCCSPPGRNAGVATAVPSFPGFPLGVTSGSYSQSFNLALASSFNPAFVTANGGTVDTARAAFVTGLQGGLTYFNIHTNRFPGGEVRGQLVSAVPEPGTWAMMLFGFSVVGYALRRRHSTAPGAQTV
jgi:hypothetical protein